MNNTENMPGGGRQFETYLLAIQGTLAPPTLEAARAIHNETAGAPPNIAAAQSLGDLCHNVYVPLERAASGASEFLILDVWNSLDGLNQFFANPHVQEQGGRIFSQRDPVVWMPAQGFSAYHLPAPYGKNERIISVVRGTVRSHAEAMLVHNAIIAAEVNKARKAGSMSHDAYLRLAPPDSPEALEFFAVDVWINASGMAQYFQNPEFVRGIQELFTAPPVTSAWVHPEGDWVEW